MIMLANQIPYGFYQGDITKISQDLQALKPTLIIIVPRLLNRFYDLINANLNSQEGFKKTIIDWGLQKKLGNVDNSGKYEHFLYDKLVFNKCKNMLGGNLRIMITGSAPVAKEVLTFLQAVFCCPILNGFGQTEGAAPTCI